MQKPIEQFHEYIMSDVLEHIEKVTSKRMFGGYGIYLDGAIFAIITSDSELFFKADEGNVEQFKELGSRQFIYTGHKNKKPTGMPYWTLPEEIMEDRERIEEWSLQSAAISKKT